MGEAALSKTKDLGKYTKKPIILAKGEKIVNLLVQTANDACHQHWVTNTNERNVGLVETTLQRLTPNCIQLRRLPPVFVDFGRRDNVLGRGTKESLIGRG